MARDDDKTGPLDGSTSGTIGGGGPDSGGPTPRPVPPDTPSVHPEDAASGRLAPDPLGAAAQRDELRRGATDVSSGGHMAKERDGESNDGEQIGGGGLDDDLTNASDEDTEDDEFDDDDEESDDEELE